MKKIVNKLNIIVTLIVIIVSTMNVSFATTDITEEEKTKITNFINEDENIIFSYYNYETVTKMPVENPNCTVYGLVGTIAKKYGTSVEDQPEDSEIYKITGNAKAKSFTKEVADSFVKSKLGITFEELEGYAEYQEKHTIATDKETFYQVLEGGGDPHEPYSYTVNAIRKLSNGNIEVDVLYTDGTLDNNGKEVENNNTVTLKLSGESYVFVSCIGKTIEKDDNSNNAIEDENKEDNKDDTVAKGEIPQTGELINFGKYVLGIIVIILIVLLIKYRYKKY